jgi:hypothetical protein
VILFAVHAVIVWALAFRWRRTWLGVGVVLLGATLPALITRTPELFRFIPASYQFMNFGVELKLLLWAESAMVLLLGGFILLLPRRPTHAHCPYCFYDTRGLDPKLDLCPECGQLMGRSKLSAGLVPRMQRGASSPIDAGPARAVSPATAATPPRPAAPAQAPPPPAPSEEPRAASA